MARLLKAVRPQTQAQPKKPSTAAEGLSKSHNTKKRPLKAVFFCTQILSVMRFAVIVVRTACACVFGVSAPLTFRLTLSRPAFMDRRIILYFLFALNALPPLREPPAVRAYFT